MRSISEAMINQSTRALVLCLAVLAVTVAGCDDDDNPAAPAPEKTNLRAIHLSPDAPEVDIYFNGSATPSVTDLSFNGGTSYLSVNAGTYDVAISPANTSLGAAVLTVNDVALVANKRYTAVAYAPVASIDALLLTDDLSTPPAGQIRVRAIHTASAVGQVDIWNIPAVGSPTILYENVDFGVAGNYLTIPAGSYTLGFDVNNDGNPELTFTTPSLAAGTVANIFAVSNAASDVYLLAQLQNSQVAQINPN